MKTKWLPAIIMLTAGAIDCVLSLIEHLSLLAFTERLLIVLVVFYVLGCVVKLIIDMNFPQMEAEAAEEAAEGEEISEEGATVTESEGAQTEPESEENADEELENINAENKSA